MPFRNPRKPGLWQDWTPDARSYSRPCRFAPEKWSGRNPGHSLDPAVYAVTMAAGARLRRGSQKRNPADLPEGKSWTEESYGEGLAGMLGAAKIGRSSLAWALSLLGLALIFALRGSAALQNTLLPLIWILWVLSRLVHRRSTGAHPPGTAATEFLSLISLGCGLVEYHELLRLVEPSSSGPLLFPYAALAIALPWLSGNPRLGPALAILLNLLPPFSVTLVGGVFSTNLGWTGALLSLAWLASDYFHGSKRIARPALLDSLVVLALVLLQGLHTFNGIWALDSSLDHLLKLMILLPAGFLVASLYASYRSIRLPLLVSLFSWAAVQGLIAWVMSGFSSFMFFGGVNANTYAIFWSWIGAVLLLGQAGRHRWLPVFASLFLLILILVVGSRAGIAAVIGSGLLVIVHRLTLKRQFSPMARTTALTIGWVTGSALIAIIVLLDSGLSNNIRATLWLHTVSGIQETWQTMIVGHGHFGPYSLLSHAVDQQVPPEVKSEIIGNGWIVDTHPHSDWLSIAYGHGLIGLLIHLVLVVRCMYTVNDSGYKLPLLAGLFSQLIFGITDPTSIAVVTGLLFWISVFGILLSPSGGSEKQSTFPTMVAAVTIILVLVSGAYAFHKKAKLTKLARSEEVEPGLFRYMADFYSLRAKLAGSDDCRDLCRAYRLRPMGSSLIRLHACVGDEETPEIQNTCKKNYLLSRDPNSILLNPR